MKSVGYRIKQIRLLRGLTQKELGLKVGFTKNSAESRISHYESGRRNPQNKVLKAIAAVLDVDVIALNTPDIDTYYGVMHTLFSLEDLYGLKVKLINGQPYLRIDDSLINPINKDLLKWYEEGQKLVNQEISVEEYNEWRYSFPAVEAKRTKQALDDIRNGK